MGTRPIRYFHAVLRGARRNPMLAVMMLYSVYFGLMVSMSIFSVGRSPCAAIIALN